MRNAVIPDALPEPLKCDSCGDNRIAFINNRIIYGKPMGAWPFCFYCYECRASVGVHLHTRIPLGRMADSDTKKLRKQAHEWFDPIWLRYKFLTRPQAYEWLADKLGIPLSTCHFARMTNLQLKQTEKVCIEFIREQKRIVIKRQEAKIAERKVIERVSKRTRTNKRQSKRNELNIRKRRFSESLESESNECD